MPYSLFELENGQQFYYDSHSNTLYNSKKEVLNLNPERPIEWYEEEADQWDSDVKSDRPVNIRILLGHACNYNCTYCLQKDIGDPSERPLSLWIDTFIESVKKNLSLDRLKRIDLWGGEPFLYWKDMVKIMDYLDDPEREFFISTNGSAFVEKHYEYFKNIKGQILINLSHDAFAQEKLRGKDVLKNPKRVEVLKKIVSLPNVRMAFGCVVSSDNYDLFEINRYFKEFKERENFPMTKLTFIPAKNYDVHGKDEYSAKYILHGDKLEDFGNIMEKFIEESLKDPKGEKIIPNNIIHDTHAGVISYAKFLKNQAPVVSTSTCGADSKKVLSVDIKGNIKLCPHTDDTFNAGRLEKLQEARIHGLDMKRKKNHCFKCNVKRLCKSSCPIKYTADVFYMNCALEKVWNGKIQLAAMKLLFGQKVKLVEVGVPEIP